MSFCNSLKDFLLTPFEIKFVQNLAKDNCTYKEAAIRAGSKSKRPEQIGSELAKKPKIRAATVWYSQKLMEAAAIDDDSLIDKTLRVYE
jgi:phage terminase small subunit